MYSYKLQCFTNNNAIGTVSGKQVQMNPAGPGIWKNLEPFSGSSLAFCKHFPRKSLFKLNLSADVSVKVCISYRTIYIAFFRLQYYPNRQQGGGPHC